MCGRQAMKQYKAIFLDWDDTIGDFHHAEHCALRDIYSVYHLERLYANFDDFYNCYHPYNIHLWELYGRSEIKKEELAFLRFYHPVESLTDGESLAKRMAEDFLKYTTRHFRLLDDVEDVVRYLAGKYPLTIVSNGFVEVQYTKIRFSGLSNCFRHIVLSEEVGAQKPNPLIYEKALQLNGLKKEDVLMIGDSYNSDIQGAINAGIDQLWLTKDLTDPRPSTYRVAEIGQLKDVL
ncbi:MAG: YjjG family noncanonical pyrimidine nucleotidase [Paludibacteraceae bacterium]|nr:YjjG family noncanonical pyrimidine nucleotidase [Paludibacteraceae bacterium]